MRLRWSVKSLRLIQTEFNKLLLECVVKTQSSVAKILGIESLSPHVSGNPKFEYANMVEDIREKVSSEMERFFPKKMMRNKKRIKS